MCASCSLYPEEPVNSTSCPLLSPLDTHQEGFENCCSEPPVESTEGPRGFQWRCLHHLETGNSVERGTQEWWRKAIHKMLAALPGFLTFLSELLCPQVFHQPIAQQHAPLCHKMPPSQDSQGPQQPSLRWRGSRGRRQGPTHSIHQCLWEARWHCRMRTRGCDAPLSHCVPLARVQTGQRREGRQ